MRVLYNGTLISHKDILRRESRLRYRYVLHYRYHLIHRTRDKKDEEIINSDGNRIIISWMRDITLKTEHQSGSIIEKVELYL